MRKKLLFVLLSVALVAATTGAITASANAYDSFNISGAIEDSYTLNETVAIPSATFTVSGKEYAANHIVYYPDGTTSSSSSVVLSLRGNYTVNYFVTVGGETYSKNYEFSTIVPFGSFQTSKSSYNYWQNPDWDTLDGTGVYSGRTEKLWGLTAAIAKNDVFTVNRILDLSKAETENPVMKFYFMPHNFGELDATRFYVKLTDAFDPENTVTLEYRLGLGTYSYVAAKATGQSWAGLQARYANGSFTGYTVHVNNAYGSVIVNNGGGLHARTCDGVQPLTFHYVSEERALYNNYAVNGHIVDLDDETYQIKPFEGFSSNYVYVSMWADGYNQDTFRVFITDLCGADLSEDYVIDDECPEITVYSKDVDIFDMPEGGVGLDYKVFDAKATDVYATSPLKLGKKVLIGYGRPSGVYHNAGLGFTAEVDCSDGYFRPNRAGVYSIIYYTTDYSGNYTEVVSNVNITADYNDASFIEIEDAQSLTEVGNRIFLAKVTDKGGYSGDCEIKYSVNNGGQPVELEGNAITGYSFVPQTAGEYNVEIALTDLVGGGTKKNYVITVAAATMPSISDDVELPAYFISEYSYKLPALYAVDYTDGMKKIKTNVKVKDGTGEWSYSGGDTSFVADADGFAEITYFVSGNERAYKIPVVSVYEGKDLALMKFFRNTSGDLELTTVKGGVSLSSRNTDGEAEFVKKILAKTFSTEILIDKDKNDFARLDLTLADSADRTESIVVSLKKEDGAASILINGIDSGKKLTNVFANDSKIVITYSAANRSLNIGGIRVAVKTDNNGREFNGFGSGYVYVSYGLKGVESRSTAYVQKLNNQTFDVNIVEDIIRPEFSLNGVYDKLIVEKGSVVTVWSASYGDVLSNIVSESVNVTFGGREITDLNGNIMKNLSCGNEYKFKAAEYGVYVISYLIKDGAGRKQGYTYTVSVVDMTAPVITTSMKDGKAALGDKVTVASATANDDLEGEVKVYVYVCCPNYQVWDINKDKYFYAKEKGVYKVVYKAQDSSGNTAYEEFEITVG